jgi:hypothetical protein
MLIDNYTERPPLGLMPKYIWDLKRFYQVCEAISNYYNAGKKILISWIEEYNELIEKINK